MNSGDWCENCTALVETMDGEWTILDFAIWYAGGCVVPIYETSSAEQVDWILND